VATEIVLDRDQQSRQAVKACPTLNAPNFRVEQSLNLCFNRKLYWRADAVNADAALSIFIIQLAEALKNVGKHG